MCCRILLRVALSVLPLLTNHSGKSIKGAKGFGSSGSEGSIGNVGSANIGSVVCMVNGAALVNEPDAAADDSADWSDDVVDTPGTLAARASTSSL
mmetsp:Transcript_112832/g.240819  ORF Transcript_112832/g.240819 Transcript_112832/m.240819 type:complete len:95 (-) Transcript_112832:104-388(-)|eukprot:CAMPEP_0180549074 /NCGR_PEP_ID=MMETSP1036_2-20121128/71928_1 /TAXON_ID=632150 /ORGANISM="Azadinium spinosum, Strain 3D9" /LENGTH=94 /DNA_ID=CAMNT_0022564257 /DNA_START=164 /DNA_END=448 /DNA_ORIENTATION=-